MYTEPIELRLFITIAGIITGLFTAHEGKKKGYPYWLWFIIGFVFGLIGLVVSLIIPTRKTKKDIWQA